tara:strand:- start:14741 stop:15676 length:936 start_codon:yes stop_codon:yes gene_type:complete
MSKPNKHLLPDSVGRRFDKSERDQIREVWDISGSLEDSVTPGETERALSDLHLRLEMTGEMKSKPEIVIGWLHKHSRLLVAAIALITLTSLFFLVPKTVVVSYGEMATVELPDGTTIEMNSGSSIRYNRFYQFTNRTVELNGEAYFSVVSHGHPFIVETNGATVEVTGTRFNVRSWNDEPENGVVVTVAEGEVYFYPGLLSENPVILHTGETSHWNRGETQPSSPKMVEMEEITAWRDLRFVFREQTLASILRDLERRYDVAIELEAEQAASTTLTAYYSQQVSLESVLNDICAVKGLRYTQTTNGYRIFK